MVSPGIIFEISDQYKKVYITVSITLDFGIRSYIETIMLRQNVRGILKKQTALKEIFNYLGNKILSNYVFHFLQRNKNNLETTFYLQESKSSVA